MVLAAAAVSVSTAHVAGAEVKKWPLVILEAKALSGQCLDLAPAMKAGKAYVKPELRQCNRKSDTQRFEVISRKGGFALRSARAASCLEALGAKVTGAGEIRLGKCDFKPPQLWSRKRLDRLWFTLVSSKTGKCLTWAAAKAAKPGNFVQGPCLKKGGNAAQLFRKY